MFCPILLSWREQICLAFSELWWIYVSFPKQVIKLSVKRYCYGLNVCATPPNSCIEILTSKGGGIWRWAFGTCLGHEGGVTNGNVPYKEVPERSLCLFQHVRTQDGLGREPGLGPHGSRDHAGTLARDFWPPEL